MLHTLGKWRTLGRTDWNQELIRKRMEPLSRCAGFERREGILMARAVRGEARSVSIQRLVVFNGLNVRERIRCHPELAAARFIWLAKNPLAHIGRTVNQYSPLVLVITQESYSSTPGVSLRWRRVQLRNVDGAELSKAIAASLGDTEATLPVRVSKESVASQRICRCGGGSGPQTVFRQQCASKST